MSGPGLTTPVTDSGDASYFSDSETDERPLSTKSPVELLSGVYRGIKKLTPSREDPTKLHRQASRTGLNRLSPVFSPISTSSAASDPSSGPHHPTKHARNLSLQNSLAKPLPETPPPQPSPRDLSPPASIAQYSGLYRIADSTTRTIEMDSRTNALDTGVSPANAEPYDTSASRSQQQESTGDVSESFSSETSGYRSTAASAPQATPRTPATGGSAPSPSSSSPHLAGLMCNVHRTTGREPPPLVGATTTVVGDKLYVFGGRILSRSRPAPLTSSLYELDLIRRHWTKLETTGDVPSPRYFHSMCALGDTKMVCYGGMSPTMASPGAHDQQPEVTVMSDIYIYDIATKKWVFIPCQEPPQGRYAHCACILPSSASFSSYKAPLSALQHNPSSGNPNEGRIGISIDGAGGAEMLIVGGQDGANHYIEQISVFNLRSLRWTFTQALGKSCGAYRSVVCPLPPSVASRIGKGTPNPAQRPEGGISQEARDPGSSMLIYSNYNFLDVKLELQIRSSDSTLSEKPMVGNCSPPGLRFPNGGVINNHFVVSGTYLTSSKQEYALWALDLRTLAWTRIDAGGSVFSHGSWNRGVLWNRRNTFVILGNRKRSLVDDYNHRRINFSNVCMVELEAFGFYDNPRKTSPMSGFVSASSPYASPGLSVARKAGHTAGGRYHSRASEELGEKALALREIADMDILCIGGERIPVNSRIIARRWGPYLVQLLREGTATQDGGDTATLRSGMTSAIRSSAGANERTTIGSNFSMASTLISSSSSPAKPPSTAPSSISGGPLSPPTNVIDPATINTAPTPRTLPPNSRPRCIYLPHTYLTIQALLHFLYTSSLPPPSSPLCTPQILCSLLQIARPYRIDGLLESVVERLHVFLDSRNAAAVFNASAMAAGGGRGIDGILNTNFFVPAEPSNPTPLLSEGSPNGHGAQNGMDMFGLASQTANLRINTAVSPQTGRPPSEELSATTSMSSSEWGSEFGESEKTGGAASNSAPREVWSGELSSVIGLQKRGLRGLMEGRRMRERTGTNSNGMTTAAGQATATAGEANSYSTKGRVGLGIAGS